MILAALLACRPGLDIGLERNPALVNEVTVTLPDLGGDVVVRCVGVTVPEDPWPEHHVFRAARGAPVTLDGLLADTTYACTAEADGDDGRFDFTTDPLPESATFATMEATELDADAVVPGFTLVNPTLWKESTRGGNYAAASVDVVVDFLGRVRWYADTTGYDGIAVFEYDPTYDDFYGGGGFFTPMPVRVWNRSAVQTAIFPSVLPDHEVERVGDHYFLLKDQEGFHCIEERDAAGILVWHWCSDEAPAIGTGGANSLAIETVGDETNLYATMPGVGLVYKLVKSTRAIAWVYGEGRDFSGDVAYAGWMHDLHVVPCEGFDRCLLFYDNGVGEEHSSIQKIGLHEDTMTAETVRTWSEHAWSEPRLGGIDEMGDNWLVGKARSQESHGDYASEIVEVGGGGEVVWRLAMTPSAVEFFRARRVGACALFHHSGMCPDLE